MPFGRKRGDDLDAKKASLFSSRSKSSKSDSPAPSGSNPYAVPPPGSNPYAAQSSNPYAAQNGAPRDPYLSSNVSEPPASSASSTTLGSQGTAPPQYSAGGYGRGPSPNRNDKSPVPPGGYGGSQSRYQNSGPSYGQSGGYGGDPYGNGQKEQSRYGPSGYGGLGRSNSQDTMTTDAGRNALFGNAAQRAAENPPQQDLPPQDGDNSYANSGGYGSTETPGSYGAGPQRELTAEEEEEEGIQASKQQIRFLKEDTLATGRRALHIMDATEQTMKETYARLGVQGEMLHNTERNLDVADSHNSLAKVQAKDLESANRPLFAPKNPFRKNARAQERINIAEATHRDERDARLATQAHAYDSFTRTQKTQRDLADGANRFKPNARSLADRAKYQFEPDEDDDEMENEIEDIENRLLAGAKNLNLGARAMGQEIDSQNKHLDRISKKADNVDDGIFYNTQRLKQISKRYG